MALLTGQNVIDWTQADSGLLATANLLVPLVQDYITDYCQNHFLNPRVYLTSAGITFENADPDTISDSEDGFVDAFFAGTNFDISVRGSYNNDGIYEVASVAAGVLTLATAETLIAETPDRAITVWKIDWPKGLPIIAARIVRVLLDKNFLGGAEEFSLADWRVKYAGVAGDMVGELVPQPLTNALKRWRSVRLY